MIVVLSILPTRKHLRLLLLLLRLLLFLLLQLTLGKTFRVCLCSSVTLRTRRPLCLAFSNTPSRVPSRLALGLLPLSRRLLAALLLARRKSSLILAHPKEVGIQSAPPFRLQEFVHGIVELLPGQFLEAGSRLAAAALLGEARVGADLTNELVVPVEVDEFVFGGLARGGDPGTRLAALVLEFLEGAFEVPTDFVFVLALLVLLDLGLALELGGERSLGRGPAVTSYVESTLVVVLLFLDLPRLLVAGLASGCALLASRLVLLLGFRRFLRGTVGLLAVHGCQGCLLYQVIGASGGALVHLLARSNDGVLACLWLVLVLAGLNLQLDIGFSGVDVLRMVLRQLEVAAVVDLVVVRVVFKLVGIVVRRVPVLIRVVRRALRHLCLAHGSRVDRTR